MTIVVNNGERTAEPKDLSADKIGEKCTQIAELLLDEISRRSRSHRCLRSTV